LGVVALSNMQSLEGTLAGEICMVARQDRLNQMDADALRRGYYEGLDVTRFDEKLAFLRSRVTEQWAGGGDRLEQNTADILDIHEDRPGGVYIDHGRTVVLNRWGMRDRDYEKTRPPGICRIALLGSSHEFGCGVAENETFENLVEDRLNAEKGRPTYEILTFAEPNYRAFQFLALVEKKVLDFTPDAVFFVVNASEFTATTEQVAKALHLGSPIPYDIITKVAAEAGVDRSMSEAQIRARIGPRAREIVSWAYRRMADSCQRRGVQLYLVYRPSPIVWNKKGADRDADIRRELLELAEEARVPVIDLSAAFDSVKNRRSLIVSEWDEHCNVKGHRLLADELYKQMHDRDGNLLLRPRAPATATP